MKYCSHLIIKGDAPIQQIAIVRCVLHFSERNSSINLIPTKNDEERIQKVNVNPPYTLNSAPLLHNNEIWSIKCLKRKRKTKIVVLIRKLFAW